MALALKFDRRALALSRARFRAWWEGEEFDEAAALAEIEASLTADNDSTDVAADEDADADANADAALFDAPRLEPPPRLAALALLWGEGRVRPGDAAEEALAPQHLGLSAEGALALLGPGLAAPVIALAGAHAGRIDVFEWREETVSALEAGLAAAGLDERVTVARIDLEACVFKPDAYDGVLSFDDFAYCSFPPHLTQQLMKTLKPGACAVLESYVGLRAAELATAFASSFAEPQIRAHGDLRQIFLDTGFLIEADDDLTDVVLETARERFRQLGERLTGGAPLEPACARELAWETEAWRLRLKLLAQRRLERRRFVLRRPADQSANANAPAG